MKDYNIKPYEENSDQQNFRREDAYLRAKEKVKKITGFYWHAASYVLVNLFIIMLIAFNSSESFWSFGTFATALFWGIGLGFHFLGVFGPNFLFGRNWEERKIKEFMDKEKHHWE